MYRYEHCKKIMKLTSSDEGEDPMTNHWKSDLFGYVTRNKVVVVGLNEVTIFSQQRNFENPDDEHFMYIPW